MKRFLKIALVLALFAVMLVACAPASQPGLAANLMQLPDEGRVLIMTLLTAGLTWLLLQLGKVIPVDFSGYGAVIAAALAPVIITAIEYFLQMIPPTYDQLVLTLIHLLVVGLGSIGLFHAVGQIRNKQVRNFFGGNRLG